MPFLIIILIKFSHIQKGDKKLELQEAKDKEQDIYIKYMFNAWYESSFVEQQEDGTYRVVINAYLGYIVPIMPKGVVFKRISKFAR
jgi:hypothetical protein